MFLGAQTVVAAALGHACAVPRGKSVDAVSSFAAPGLVRRRSLAVGARRLCAPGSGSFGRFVSGAGSGRRMEPRRVTCRQALVLVTSLVGGARRGARGSPPVVRWSRRWLTSASSGRAATRPTAKPQIR